MAYTNAIFYMNLVSGSDTARTTFAPTNYSNNGSGAVRVNRTAHGLVTGAVVDITGSGVAGYNQAWKITRIDADNFDLDTSTYTSNPATKGTVAPRGGSSWSDAWRTPSSGATAARVAAGDTIRIAKTDDPVSVGNGTWTSLSSTVTLATAQTATIDNCETAWTAANSATVARNGTTQKQGSFYMSITTPATGTLANTKYAYYTLPATLDLSGYQQITLWITAAVSTANIWVVNLCSDTSGNTVVDSFTLPSVTPGNTAWVPVTITKTGGGNLGNSIASIAIYTGVNSPGNSSNMRIDNISACKTNNLNLNTLIGQSSNGFSLTQPWHPIQSIDGTTITIDQLTSTTPSGTLGYYTEGTSPSTVTTYILNPLLQAIVSSTSSGIYTINTTGTATSPVVYSGGWNTTNTTQDGVTWVDNRNSGGGILFYTGGNSRNYNSFFRIGASRMYGYFNNSGVAGATDGDLDLLCSGMTLFGQTSSVNSGNVSGYWVCSQQLNKGFGYYTNIIAYNVSSAFQISGYINNLLLARSNGNYNPSGFVYAKDVVVRYCNIGSSGTAGNVNLGNNIWQNLTTTNGTLFGLQNSSGSKVYNLVSNNNASGAIADTGGSMYLFNPTITDSTLIGSNVTTQYTVGITNFNGSATDSRLYTEYGNSITQTAVRKSATGVAWQTSVTNTIANNLTPFKLSVAKIACTGNKQVTVKAWVKLSHATDIGAKLVVLGGQVPGITNDVTATKTADTNWEELTLTFTPTIACVVEVELQSYWLANVADESTYIDDMTITELA